MILILILPFIGLYGQSPNADEWLRQKRTQRRYLIQQIAALKVYLEYLKKGYDIAQKGLTNIGNIKDDALGRDKNYLHSLKEVSPVIRDSPKLVQTMSYQEGILKVLRKLNDDAKGDPNLSPDEVDYIGSVYSNMIKECDVAIDELTTIATAEQAEMKDDERLDRLDKIHEDMADKYAFAQDFSTCTRLLSLERARERHSINSSKKIFEL